MVSKFQPARGEHPVEVVGGIAEVLRKQGRLVLCTVVRVEGSTSGKPGWKLMVAPDGFRMGNLGGGACEALVSADAVDLLAENRAPSQLKRYYLTEEALRGEATGMACGGMAEVFLEMLSEPPSLLICGAGPVGQALAQAGALAGFRILVVDDREDYRSPGLFPDGTLFPAAGRGLGEHDLGDYLESELFVAVVSRCWETDIAAMASVLRQEPVRLRYLGLMGSERKIARVKDEVAALGYELGGGLFVMKSSTT